MNTAMNKTAVLQLTNKTGATRYRGAVVRISPSDPSSFISCASPGLSSSLLGVVLDKNGTAADAVGPVAVSGYVSVIHLDSAASIGQTFFSSATPYYATPHSVITVGDFGQCLDPGASPAAWLWGLPVQSGGGNTVYALVEHHESSGTNGGTLTVGPWNTRILNTIVSDDSSVVSLNSNQITLAAGTYVIDAHAPCYSGDGYQIRLQNVTDAATILIGTSEFAYHVDNVATRSHIRGKFTIADSKALEIQMQVGYNPGSNNTGGVATGYGTEVYTSVQLWGV